MQRYERDPRSFRGNDDRQRPQGQRGAVREDDRWESRDAQRGSRDHEDGLASYAEQGQWRESATGHDEDTGYRSDFAQQRYGRGQEVNFGQDYDEQRGRPRGTYGAGREYGSASGQYGSRTPYGENARAGWSNEAVRQGYANPRSPYGQGSYANERHYGYGEDAGYDRDLGRAYDQGIRDYDRSGQGYVGAYGSDLGYGTRPRPRQSESPRQWPGQRDTGYGYGEQRGGGHYAYGNSGAQGQVGRYDDAREDAWGRGLGDRYGQGYGQDHGQDQAYGQGLRGRGPKNYTRSDERIREDLSERLSDDAAIDASEINVEVRNGVVTLTGSVDARHLKHRVEDLADRCSGVKDVENRLTVQRSLGNARSGTLQSQSGVSGAGGSTTAGSTRNEDTQKKH